MEALRDLLIHCCAIVRDDSFGSLRINDDSIINTSLLRVGVKAKESASMYLGPEFTQRYP